MTDTQPNILFVLADQMAAPALPVYGHPIVRTPHMERLAETGVVFENAYCNAPICAPSRFSMLSGRLPSRIGAYDNAAEFPSSVPTIAHYLRLAGYRTCAAGKMHFIGADQQHGFENRLTTDIYPADFGWTPDWRRPDERLEWFHNLVNVVEAGPSARTLQIDFDEEVAFRARRWLYDHVRSNDARPFFLLVSFSHPHDPYNIPPEYWDRYEGIAIDMPRVPATPPGHRDPHSRRLYDNYDRGEFEITEAHVRNARRAYYGAMSFIDDRIGELLQVLDATGQSDTTIVVIASDHGDMLGERGMWYKMTFFEWAARVPLIVHAPNRCIAGRRRQIVSLVDILPTLLDLAGTSAPAPIALDGRSLAPLVEGSNASGPGIACGEYFAEGSVAPIFMVRKDSYKYITCPADPPQLYEVDSDPLELDNLAGRPDHADAERHLAEIARGIWDAERLSQDIVSDQQQRRLVYRALMTGNRTLWDYEPPQAEARAYIRNVEGLYEREAGAFLPPRKPPDGGP
ncbi:MAG: choline-sulfatase [Rhodospirillales bacterium]|nr:MAG: choline-sulfatase [Rhodospirillales bacterium]